jgi:hypothetical protein
VQRPRQLHDKRAAQLHDVAEWRFRTGDFVGGERFYHESVRGHHVVDQYRCE